jgi:hypothetical protein
MPRFRACTPRVRYRKRAHVVIYPFMISSRSSANRCDVVSFQPRSVRRQKFPVVRQLGHGKLHLTWPPYHIHTTSRQTRSGTCPSALPVYLYSECSFSMHSRLPAVTAGLLQRRRRAPLAGSPA